MAYHSAIVVDSDSTSPEWEMRVLLEGHRLGAGSGGTLSTESDGGPAFADQLSEVDQCVEQLASEGRVLVGFVPIILSLNGVCMPSVPIAASVARVRFGRRTRMTPVAGDRAPCQTQQFRDPLEGETCEAMQFDDTRGARILELERTRGPYRQLPCPRPQFWIWIWIG